MIPNFLTKIKRRRLGVVTAALAVASVLLFAGAQTAHAQVANCMEDNWSAAGNNQSLQCTAKEVFIDEDANGDKLIDVTIVDGDGCDFPGDTATVNIVASIHFNSDRLDVGVYSALDGGNALTGDCAVDILDPDNPVDLVDGPGSTTVTGTTGSFDVKPATPPTQDECGDAQFDVGGGGNLDAFSFQTLVLECVDDDGDGFLDFSTCFSWRVDGSDDFCDGTQTDVYPGTPSKCFCETSNINVPVPRAAKIEVIKDLIPEDAAGLFDLLIDGEVKADDVGDGGTTGAVTVSAGFDPPGDGETHTVGEAAGGDPITDLATYDTSIECVDRDLTTFDGGPPLTTAGIGPLDVLVMPDDDIVCTITNTRKAGNITVEKTGDDLSKVGDDVTYTVTITNDGAGKFPLQLDEITDSLVGDLMLSANYDTSTCADLTDDILPADDSCAITYTYTVDANDVVDDPDMGNVVKNTVTVKASDPNDPGPDIVVFTGSDSKYVDIFEPAITFSKTGSPTTLVEGTPVNYTLTLTNASSDITPGPLTCSISDPALGINQIDIPLSGSPVVVNQSKTWDPDGADSGACSAAAGDTFDCKNTATATCFVPDPFGNELEKTAEVTVNVIPADVALTVEKDCSAYSKVSSWEGWTADDKIDYEIVIKNGSGIPLNLVAITDLVLGDLTSDCTSPLAPQGQAGDTCTITEEYEVTVDGDDLTNSVTVTFNDGSGGNITTDAVTCTTDLLHPDLTVAKSCISDEPVPAGTTANFEIRITNGLVPPSAPNGDVPLLIDVVDNDLDTPINLTDVFLGTAPMGGCLEGDYGDGGGDPAADATDGCLLLEGGITASGTSVSNRVDVTATLPAMFGLSNVLMRGADSECDVAQDGATRTWGFWKTHGSDEDPMRGYTCHVFEDENHLDGSMDLGWKQVTSCNELFGIFWASKAKDSNGDKRDKTCMTQLQGSRQLAAALLNSGLDNGAPLDAQLVADMQAALAAGNRQLINQLGGQLAEYNESFDDVAIIDNDGAMIPHADPNGTRDEADFPFADCNGNAAPSGGKGKK